jgi:hypothetical protein
MRRLRTGGGRAGAPDGSRGVDGVCREACCLAHRQQGLQAGRCTAPCTSGPGSTWRISRLWKAKSSRETCHLRLPLAASTEAAWACSASIRLISRRMRTRLIRILSGPLLIRLAGLAVKGVCGRAISVPFPYAGQVTRRCRLIGARTLRARPSFLGCETPHEP